MLDKQQQIRNSLIYLVPTLIGSLLPILMMPILTRILTPEDYGFLALANVYAVLVSGLSNVGLLRAYDREFFRYSDETSSAELLYSILWLVLIALSATTLLTWGFRRALSSLILQSPDHGALLTWVYCSTSVGSLKVYHMTYLKNSRMATHFAAYTLGGVLLATALSLLFVVVLRLGVLGIAWSSLGANLAVLAALSLRMRRRGRPTFNRRMLADALKLGYPLTPRVLFGVISTQADKYLIGLLASTTDVGLYAKGQQISQWVFTWMTSLQNVFHPEVYRLMFDRPTEEGQRAIGKYLTPFIYASIGAGLLVVALAEEAFHVLTPASYHGAIDLTMVLAMYYGSLFFGKISGPQLVFVKKTYLVSLLTVGTIGLNAGISIPLILTYGALGAAWGTFLAGAISTAISLVVAQRYYKIRWEWKQILAIFLTFYLAGIGLLWMRRSGTPYVIRVLTKATAMAVFAYIGVKIRVLTRENGRVLWGLARNVFSRSLWRNRGSNNRGEHD